MTRDPDFFLTAAGEYRPLAEPRACWIEQHWRDVYGNECLVVHIEPSLQSTDVPPVQVSSLLLTPRHQGRSLHVITLWPAHVYVSRMACGAPISEPESDECKWELIAWGRLHADVAEAVRDFRQHAAAMRAMRSPDTLHARQLRFLGEQDGSPERLLKDQLRIVLDHHEHIARAYLARVDWGLGTPIQVSLCMKSIAGPDTALVRKVSNVFALIFHKRQTLDILFIDSEQEEDLASVCEPFYIRAVP